MTDFGAPLKALRRKLVELAGAFRHDQNGTVAMIFALALVPLLLMVGLAVDYSNASRLRSHLGDALDSAVIAAAKELESGNTDQAALQQLARDIIDANLAGRGGSSKLSTFALAMNVEDGSVRIDATITVDTYLMALAGYDKIDIVNNATAKASSRDVELVMALDVTGSMGGSKITDLRDAAKDLVDILLPDEKAKKKVRIGLVPYSQGINAGPYADTSTNGESTRCATERDGASAANDDSYSGAPLHNGTSSCPGNEILPMTNVATTLKQRIDALSATGRTAGQTGIGWSWYMLSPNWSSLWPADSKPEPYLDEKNMKVAVLMTDGQFNTYYDWDWVYNRRLGRWEYVWTEISGSSVSEQRARTLCDNMKSTSRDIVIYSVAFKAPTSAKNLLKYCATNATTHYFDAENGAELRTAFRIIANDVNRLRLTE
ncbi:MAG: hypothetical protein KDJ16_16935 [Hyphomicrobiales bacterium]|nr:hypothetical protein [Hyphomicrobiales bacterium]